MGLGDFFHPETLEEALTLIKRYENTKVLAGGTDLVLQLNRREVNCDYIVSLDKIKALKEIREEEGTVVIGAMITFTDLINNKIVRDNFKAIINCSETMGSPQIRNVATIGGNIINAGSAADAVPCVIALGGVLIFKSLRGVRKVKCEDYFRNFKEEKIKDEEILVCIEIEKTKALTGYYKLGKRNSLAIARLSSAVNLEIENEVIKGMKIAVGAVGRHPFRVRELEAEALNKKVKWLYSEEALNYLSEAVEKSIGGRKTMPFKKEAIKGVFKEALNKALFKATISSFKDNYEFDERS